jgi:hypothetical protein
LFISSSERLAEPCSAFEALEQIALLGHGFSTSDGLAAQFRLLRQVAAVALGLAKPRR